MRAGIVLLNFIDCIFVYMIKNPGSRFKILESHKLGYLSVV